MENQKQRVDLPERDNISLTALRILYIFKMLLKSPCDDSDINTNLKNKIKDSRNLSKDTICIYLNTLRLLGCNISRSKRNNNYKYTLVSHPFGISLSKNEVDTLIELRKYISTLCEWKTAIEVDNLYNKLYKHLDPYSKKFFSSTKKHFLKREIFFDDIYQDIKQLEKYCRQNKTIMIIYDSPESGEKNITLNAEKITMENSAFYLWGYSQEHKATMYLRLDRIKDIKSVSLKNIKPEQKPLKVKYQLNGKLIEADVNNKFRFFQEVLSHGSQCYIIEPQEVRQEMLNMLKSMLVLYEDDSMVY